MLKAWKQIRKRRQCQSRQKHGGPGQTRNHHPAIDSSSGSCKGKRLNFLLLRLQSSLTATSLSSDAFFRGKVGKPLPISRKSLRAPFGSSLLTLLLSIDGDEGQRARILKAKRPKAIEGVLSWPGRHLLHNFSLPLSVQLSPVSVCNRWLGCLSTYFP